MAPPITPTKSAFASPPPLSRLASVSASVSSAASSTGGGASGTSVHGSDKKKRPRTRLRDYYGLADGAAKKGDPMDIDSPSSFNPEMYFSNLAATSSIPDLLRKENELINDIRELDGERQSLVYNHHSELIDASETIKKMKSRALALDASLDSLKASFQSISQLSTSLASSSSFPVVDNSSLPADSLPPSAAPPTPPNLASSSLHSPSTPTSSRFSPHFDSQQTPRPRSQSHPQPPAPPITFDPLIHLPILLSLPLLLKHSDKEKKAELWGQWEPALRSWEEEGIKGVREVGNECRERLREARRSSMSLGRAGEERL